MNLLSILLLVHLIGSLYLLIICLCETKSIDVEDIALSLIFGLILLIPCILLTINLFFHKYGKVKIINLNKQKNIPNKKRSL